MLDYHFEIPATVLPPDQPIIETSGTKRVIAMVKYVISARRRYPKMLALLGPPGIGKTVASFAILQHVYAIQNHTGSALVIRIELEDERPTPTEIGRLIAERLTEDMPRKATKYELSREIKKIIKENDIRLIIVDEADLLDIHGLEFLRGLFQHTGCSILLVGLPHLEKLFGPGTKFGRRMARPVKLEALKEPEVVNDFLPQLIFSHWKYDPKIPADKQLGKLLWDRTSPSLSALRDVIDVANDLAKQKKIDHITRKEVLDACKMVPGARVVVKKAKPKNKTPYERESEERHAAKDRNKNGN